MKKRIVLFVDEYGFDIFKRILLLLKINFKNVLFVFSAERFLKFKYKFTGYKKINFFLHKKIDREELYKKLINSNIGIICSYNKILEPKLIKVFKLGVINFHIGDLPKYAGSNTLQWSIINGEKKIAISVHYITKLVDSGPLIRKIFIPIKTRDNSISMQNKIKKVFLKFFINFLYSFRSKKYLAKKQNLKERIVWPKRTYSDSEVKWNDYSDFKISCLTRAQVGPLPKPFFFDLKGQKIIILKPMSEIQIKKLRKKVFNK